MIYLQGKPKYSEKTCPVPLCPPQNPTWIDPGANPGLRGERPATNRLSHGTAFLFVMGTILITRNRNIKKRVVEMKCVFF
jgi:hypothetical protein